MRIILAVGAFLLSFAVGMTASWKLKKRREILEQLSLMLGEFSIEMRYIRPTLGQLIQSVGGEFGRFLHRTDDEPPVIWESACDMLSATGWCNNEEIILLRSLGGSLGTTNTDGQLSVIALHNEKLQLLLEKARQEEQKKSRMLRMVGTLCGVGAAVMLI